MTQDKNSEEWTLNHNNNWYRLQLRDTIAKMNWIQSQLINSH